MQRNEQGKTLAQLLTEAEASVFLAVARKTLARWRSLGIGPEFIQIGTRGIRYARDDLNLYIATQRRRSTSDTGPDQQPPRDRAEKNTQRVAS